MTARCADCRYAELGVNDDGPMVECRRYPPQLFVLYDDEASQAWPQMASDGWCGEFTSTEGQP